MRKTVKTAIFGVVALAGLMATDAAKADHVGVGLGLSDGYGNFLSLGVNTGGRHGCGPRYYGGGYICPAPVVVAPAPVYVQPAPVYVQPAPVVAAQPVAYVQQPAVVVAQPGGYWVETDNRVWVDGLWIDVTDSWGRRVRQQQPGHWENHHGREWRGGGQPGGHGDGPGGFNGGRGGQPGGHGDGPGHR